MVESLHCIVTGLVQGVGFRAWTLRTARGLGLTGWVRNLPDGRVELVAQGPGPALRHFTELLRQGPPMARVDTLDATPGPPDEVLAEFSVRR